MTRLSLRLLSTLALLGVLFVACGDDDNPVAADSPCDDANTTCLRLQAKADEMVYTAEYVGVLDVTLYSMAWTADAAAHVNYGPGHHVLAVITFDPPIEVRFNHRNAFVFNAGPGGSFNKFTHPTPKASSPDWTYTSATVDCFGSSGTSAVHFRVQMSFESLTHGQKLHSATFDVTIPETYDDDDPVLEGDIGTINFSLTAAIPGNVQGDPPAWPEGYPLPLSAPRTEVIR